MGKVKRTLLLFKEKGLSFFVLHILSGGFHRVALPVSRLLLNTFTKVDRKKVLFYSRPDYSDNAKVLFEYMMQDEAYKDYKFVWLMEKSKSDFPKVSSESGLQSNRVRVIKGRLKYCDGYTFKALKETATAGIIFFTHVSPTKDMPKRPGQLVVNLWHGCGYKAAEATGGNLYKATGFDMGLVPGPVFVDTKAKFWGAPKEKIQPIGYPRYDLVLQDRDEDRKLVEELIKGTDGKCVDNEVNKHIILWMPTFRYSDNPFQPEHYMKYEYDLPVLKSEADLIELDNYCRQKKTILVIKRHPKQPHFSGEALKLTNVKFVDNDSLASKGVEIYSLFKYTYGLISDYSSAPIDYMLVNKPIAFSLDDYDEYKKRRDFVFENLSEYMPGHKVKTLGDLKGFIDDVMSGNDTYLEDRNRLMKEFHNPCDNYCKRVLDKVDEIISLQSLL